ncbi:MAG: hypothetical protein Q8L90_10810 [Bacteroidota bacterium]|nr:hypothetical protein [Bacteroidota bacterium]
MSFQEKVSYKTEHIPIDIIYLGIRYKGEAIPIPSSCREEVCYDLEIILNGESFGFIHSTADGWKLEKSADQGLVDAIGGEIFLWYE